MKFLHIARGANMYQFILLLTISLDEINDTGKIVNLPDFDFSGTAKIIKVAFEKESSFKVIDENTEQQTVIIQVTKSIEEVERIINDFLVTQATSLKGAGF